MAVPIPPQIILAGLKVKSLQQIAVDLGKTLDDETFMRAVFGAYNTPEGAEYRPIFMEYFARLLLHKLSEVDSDGNRQKIDPAVTVFINEYGFQIKDIAELLGILWRLPVGEERGVIYGAFMQLMVGYFGNKRNIEFVRKLYTKRYTFTDEEVSVMLDHVMDTLVEALRTFINAELSAELESAELESAELESEEMESEKMDFYAAYVRGIDKFFADLGGERFKPSVMTELLKRLSPSFAETMQQVYRTSKPTNILGQLTLAYANEQRRGTYDQYAAAEVAAVLASNGEFDPTNPAHARFLRASAEDRPHTKNSARYNHSEAPFQMPPSNLFIAGPPPTKESASQPSALKTASKGPRSLTFNNVPSVRVIERLSGGKQRRPTRRDLRKNRRTTRRRHLKLGTSQH
jgi:hypothetical protein